MVVGICSLLYRQFAVCASFDTGPLDSPKRELMPYTAAQLNQYVTTVNQGVPPDAATQTLLAALAAQNQAGTLSDAQTLNSALRTPSTQSTTDVALATYEFFTGSIPSAAGLAFLVNNPSANANGLSSVYYQTFNQENRYYNFAINLGVNTASASSAQFAATYGGLTLAQTVQSAYEKIVGTSNAAAIADITGRIPFFQQVARERAGNFNQDLATKAIIVGYILNESIKADVGAYAQAIDAFNISLSGANPFVTPVYGVDIVNPQNGNAVVSLTNGTDVLTANVFNAGQVYTPGGDDRINSLQDEDNLTGTGNNPTLNLTFGNNNDNGSTTITPILNNIQTVNVAFTASGVASPTLDLQDAKGVNAINITRITDTNGNVTVQNLASEPATLSIANTNSPAANVIFRTTDAALSGVADSTTLTLSNVTVNNIVNETQGGVANGVETINLISTGSANSAAALYARGLQTLNISGSTNLNLGDNNTKVVNGTVPAAGQTEATRFAPAFDREVGTLTKIDATNLKADLSVTLGAEVTGNSVASSGGPVNFTYLGAQGNDTVRITAGITTTGDNIDGGLGVNTLVVGGADGAGVSLVGSGVPATTSTLKNFQALEVRTGTDAGVGADTTTVDASLVGGLTTILVRNEGQQQVGGVWTSAAETATVNLTKLSAAQAAGITALHGTTGNNATASTTINATLGTDTAADLVTLTLGRDLNTDQRFNLTLNAGNGTTNKVESVTLTDSDNESNTVKLGNVAVHTGTITLTGGVAGQFMNLDATANELRLDQTGSVLPAAPADLVGFADPGAGAAERIVAATIDASTSLNNNIVRVSQGATGVVGAQTITMGAGADTVIFDAISTPATVNNTAGLSISDKVAGGLGLDTLVIDGDVSDAGLAVGAKHILIGASEWTNVTGFETVRLIGDAGVTTATKQGFAGGTVVTNGNGGAVAAFGTTTASAIGDNAYNLVLTNDMIVANGVATAGVTRVNIVNDNDTANNTFVSAAATLDTVGTGVESGVTIDARGLIATNSFTYNGEEGASRTTDRFVLSDANINGTATIDGGAYYAGASGTYAASNLANADVLEARNASVVTLGDLAGLSNIGTLEFTNDTAVVQNSVLQLNDTILDALVNSSKAAVSAAAVAPAVPSVERMTIHGLDNNVVGGAVTGLNLDASAVSDKFAIDVLLGRGLNSVVATAGADRIVELGNYATGAYANTADGGTNTAAADTRLNIDALANNTVGNRVAADNINGGAGIDTLVVYGNISFVGATITNIEAFEFHSNVTITETQYRQLVAAANASGNTTGSVITFVGPGPHTLTVASDGSVGGPIDASRINGGTDSGSFTFTNSSGDGTTGAPTFPNDVTAPAAPAAPTLAPASDSGTVGDFRTNVTTPTFTGTAEKNSTVNLYDSATGSTVKGTAIADGTTGAYSITSSAITGDGGHSFTVKATDGNGNVSSASAASGITLDTTAPVAGTLALSGASDTGYSNSDGITSNTTPTVTGTVEANATVALFDGATQVGTATANGAGNYSITSSALSAGSHNLTVKATDAAGNVGVASATTVVTIDTTAPVFNAAGSVPADNATTIAGESDNGTANVANVSVTLQFDSPLGSVDGSKLHFFNANNGFAEVAHGAVTLAVAGTTTFVTTTFATAATADNDHIIVNFDAGFVADAAGNQTVALTGFTAYDFYNNY